MKHVGLCCVVIAVSVLAVARGAPRRRAHPTFPRTHVQAGEDRTHDSPGALNARDGSAEDRLDLSYHAETLSMLRTKVQRTGRLRSLRDLKSQVRRLQREVIGGNKELINSLLSLLRDGSPLDKVLAGILLGPVEDEAVSESLQGMKAEAARVNVQNREAFSIGLLLAIFGKKFATGDFDREASVDFEQRLNYLVYVSERALNLLPQNREGLPATDAAVATMPDEGAAVVDAFKRGFNADEARNLQGLWETLAGNEAIQGLIEAILFNDSQNEITALVLLELARAGPNDKLAYYLSHLRSGSNSEHVASRLFEVITESQTDGEAAKAGIQALSTNTSRISLTLVHRLLSAATDEDLQAVLIKAIDSHPHSDNERVICEAANHSSPGIRRVACLRLAKRDSTACFEALSTLAIKDPEPDVRSLAVDALRYANAPLQKRITVLRYVALNDTDLSIREKAARIAEQLAGEK